MQTLQLDTTALYGGRSAIGNLQQRSRESITLAVYKEARANRATSTVWAIVAVLHLAIVFISLVTWPTLSEEIQAAPGYVFGISIWLLGDIIYLTFYPQIHADYQAQMDRLEGKIPPRQR
jgi:hypothetical protein